MARGERVSLATLQEAARKEYRLLNNKFTHATIAKRVGCSPGYVFKALGNKAAILDFVSDGEAVSTQASKPPQKQTARARTPESPQERLQALDALVASARDAVGAPPIESDEGDEGANPLIGMPLEKQLEFMINVLMPEKIWLDHTYHSKNTSEGLQRTANNIATLRKTLGLSLEKQEPPAKETAKGLIITETVHEIRLPPLRAVPDEPEDAAAPVAKAAI